MGYYSKIEFGVKVKPNKIKALKTALKNVNPNKVEPDYLQSHLEGIEIIDGYLKLKNGDYYRKWYQDEEMVKFLAPFLDEGTINFTGEDGEKWGYLFDGKGGVFHLDYSKPVKGSKIC